ncbi:MAG: glycosyltransferase family 2 protein [Turneriella sp.]
MSDIRKPEVSEGGLGRKIAVVAMIRNEEEIIELFIRHAFSFCDCLYICNHNSSDRTVEIVNALASEGLSIHISTSTAAGHPQEQVTHGLIQQAIADGAEWIVPLDADEFPFCEGGVIRETILSLDPDVEWRYLWRNYFLNPDEDSVESIFFRRFKTYSDSQVGKCIFHSRLYKNRFCRITNGNHFLKFAGRRNFPEVKSIPGMKLIHFPVQTLGRWVWKNILYTITADNPGYETFVRSGWMTPDLKKLAEHYACSGNFSQGMPPIPEIVTKYTQDSRFAFAERFVISQLTISYREYYDRAVRTGLIRFGKMKKYRELFRYGFVAMLSTAWGVIRRARYKYKSPHGQQLTAGLGGYYVNFGDY